MSNEQKNNEEEVDLGSLFIIIGRGFSKLFAFIGSIFKGVFDFFIQTLIFIKKHTFKIGIATIIGAIVGGFFHVNSKDKFISEMIVQPNYGSAKQLYSVVNYYEDLVVQRDTVLLAKSLGVSIEAAATLKRFKIEPLKDKNDIVDAFDNVIKRIDTTTIKSLTFKDFTNTFTDFDYRNHRITVTSTKNNIFNKLTTPIVSSVTNNSFFNKIKKVSSESIERSDSLLKKNLHQVDSLRKVYYAVLINEAKKQEVGTSIDMGGGNARRAKEIELFETDKSINDQLKKINIEKARKTNIINVIAEFQPIGHKVKGLKSNLIVQFALFGAFVMILWLLLVELNRYLENYRN